jgi:hypothetical protein
MFESLKPSHSADSALEHKDKQLSLPSPIPLETSSDGELLLHGLPGGGISNI